MAKLGEVAHEPSENMDYTLVEIDDELWMKLSMQPLFSGALLLFTGTIMPLNCDLLIIASLHYPTGIMCDTRW